MADADTSSYQNKVLPLNPLDTFNKAATLQGALNQNKLFQQEFQSKQALSRIYKEAINPDGTLDFEKLRTLQASDPSLSYGLPQAYQQSQEAQSRNTQIDTAKLENMQKRVQVLSGYFAPLMKPGSSSKDVATALAHAKTNGVAPDKDLLEMWLSLPRDQAKNIIEDQIPAWAQAQQLKVMSAQERLQAMSPAPTMVDTGEELQPWRLSQTAPPVQAGPGIPKGIPPTTPRFDPGRNQMVFGGPGGGAAAQGRPGADLGQGGPSQGGGLAAGPPLGAPEAAAATGTFSAQQGNTLQGRADRVMENKAILGNLEGELDTPGFTTGPGTETMANLVKLVNAQTGSNFRAEGLSAREQFNKLAGMLAQSQFQALGGTGTDAKLDATTLTSPNSELSKMGNKGIIALLKGNEDAIAAKNQAWQAWQQTNGPQSYGQFSTQFNKVYDPRVFQSQYLDAKGKQTLIKGLTQPEKNKLFQAFQTAKQNGWIQ